MTVIGPIPKDDWRTLSEVLTSINWMKRHNKAQYYTEAIRLEKDLYNEYKSKYCKYIFT